MLPALISIDDARYGIGLDGFGSLPIQPTFAPNSTNELERDLEIFIVPIFIGVLKRRDVKMFDFIDNFSFHDIYLSSDVTLSSF
jgi:hypothetical protein